MILFIWEANSNFTAEFNSSSSNMAFLLSFLFVLLASCIVNFDVQHFATLREIYQGNATALILGAFKSLSSLEYEDIFGSFYGPPFYTTGRWNLLSFMDSNNLLVYDFQWEPKENLMLFPKQWYEDEELVYTWSSILKENGISRFNKVSLCSFRWRLNCSIIFGPSSVLLTH